MRLYQVRILTDDFARAFEFYAGTLELQIAWGDIAGPYAAFSCGGQAHIAIFERSGMAEASPDLAARQAPDQAGSSPMVVLQVDNVDRVFDHLRGKGVQFANSPRDYPAWTIRAVHLRDPDGVLIEVFEPLPEDQWTAGVRAKNAQAAGPTT